MPQNALEIVKRYSKLRDDRANFESRWDRMAPYVAPSRYGIQAERFQGQTQMQDVYDSTAIHAADILAKFIAGSVTNAATKWFSLRIRQEELNDEDEVREWLDETRDRIHAEFNRSNFYAEASEMYVDLGGFGTGSLFCQEMPVLTQTQKEIGPGFRGLRFEANLVGRYVIGEDALGRVDTHMFEFQLPARSAVDRWGAGNLPESVRHAAIKEPDKPFRFLRSVFPRETFVSRAPYRNVLKMPWAVCYIEMESKQKITESGFEEFPYFVPRWQKTPGETYGRGPGDIAFPDTWSLNEAKRLGFEDWALKIRPPVLVSHDSVMGGTIRLRPGAPTVIRTKGNAIGDLIRPYETGSHPEVESIKEEELRRSIRQIYMIDQILSLLEVEKTQMTAYEFSKKLELMQRLLGPIWGRLQSEFLNPLIDRVFNIMFRQGAFSPPPDILLELGGEIDVEFEGPLAKAQRASEIDAYQAGFQDATMIAKVQTELYGHADAMDYYDMDEAVKLSAQIRGVPAKVIRSDDQVQELRKARAEAQEQTKEMEEAMAGAEMAGKVAPMVKAVQGGRAA